MQCTKCANRQFIKSFRSKVHVKTNAEKIQLTIPQFCENNTGVKVSPFHLMDAYAYLFQATICGRTSYFDHPDLCTARSEPARTLEVAKGRVNINLCTGHEAGQYSLLLSDNA